MISPHRYCCLCADVREEEVVAFEIFAWIRREFVILCYSFVLVIRYKIVQFLLWFTIHFIRDEDSTKE